MVSYAWEKLPYDMSCGSLVLLNVIISSFRAPHKLSLDKWFPPHFSSRPSLIRLFNFIPQSATGRSKLTSRHSTVMC